jgi:biotin carboxylase
MAKKHIVVFIEMAPRQAVKEVKKEMPDCKVLLLRDQKSKLSDVDKQLAADIVVYVDFTDPDKIAAALLPYQKELLVITARGESGASRLGKVAPHVPYLRTPTPESLLWATDKYEMRKRLRIYDRTITPAFALIRGATKTERTRLIEKVGFPMVVKPVALEESKLVSICYHEEELEKALKNMFRKLRTEYEKLNRLQEPTAMAESYMEGEMYSVDSYVDSRGKIWHCPLVRVKTGKDIGHQDFYNYLQMTPTILKRPTIERAQLVAEKAVHALGLRSVTAHIELMKIDDEWKVIEVGPRVGGFRPLLYELSCDINHSLNDILIRKPKRPVIPKKCKGFACAMKWFADKEGVITEMKGVKKVEELSSYESITINKKLGDRSVFARNGGKSVFNLIMYNADRSKLLADIRRVEQMVEVKVAARGTVKKVTDAKKPAKKKG